MLASFKDVWRRYRWSEELWAKYAQRTLGTYPWAPDDVLVQKIILAAPIARILGRYPSYGLSPVALAAITRQKPSDVWQEVQLENWNYLDWCSTTQLPVVDRFTPAELPDYSCRMKPSGYSSGRAWATNHLEQEFDDWLAERDEERWSVGYHRIESCYPIETELRRSLRFANTLGLTLEEAKPHLISEEEAREICRPIPPTPEQLEAKKKAGEEKRRRVEAEYRRRVEEEQRRLEALNRHIYYPVSWTTPNSTTST